MSNPDDNVSKTNGLGTDPMQRLASFKPPRDLSLGGAKPSKKVFIPNLNVTRNKNKGPSSNSRDYKKDDKNRKDRKNDRNKNLKNGPNIIKSSGVFSEGVGTGERHSHSRAGYASSREAESKPVLQKPTIRVKDVIKIDKELEEQHIRSVTCQGTLGDEDAEDFKNDIDNEAPIKLPMDDGGWSHSQSKTAVQIKTEVVVKTEPVDADIMVEATPTALGVKSLPAVKQEAAEDTDVVDLLRTDQPALILFTLPDTLPGRGESSAAEPPRRKKVDEPSTSTDQSKEEEKPTESKCQLRNLEEGRIGKLLIHRSGRVTFALGDTSFEVNLGTKSPFHQEVVSVASDDASRSASLIALGALQHKLSAVPEWETLFMDMPA